MKQLEVSLDQEKVAYLPGETLQGQVAWSLDKIPTKGIDVRLVWYTKGMGTSDVGVVSETVIAVHREQGKERFSFSMPPGPYSFSGNLITLQWLVEAFAGKVSGYVEFVMSPTGQEVQL
ncbi:MAG: hypothetical protein FJ220_06075 [Kiritimatiellaceae bacterium]|nr:hypothetical protein [Kiritimatiellaceae bacterium]